MKAIPGHNGLGCISMDKTGESQRTSEANLNEPFNILVVTNSKRQATQKTKLSFSFVFIVGHLYTLSSGRGERWGHGTRDRTQDMRAGWFGWPGDTRMQARTKLYRQSDQITGNVSGYQSSCCCRGLLLLLPTDAMRRCCLRSAASPACIPIPSSGIHVPGDSRHTTVFGTSGAINYQLSSNSGCERKADKEGEKGR